MKCNTDEGNDVNPEKDIYCNTGVSHLCVCLNDGYIVRTKYPETTEIRLKKSLLNNIELLSNKNVSSVRI